MGKEKLWTKEFIVLSTINFLISLMFFLLIVTIATYAKMKFNASTSTAGLVSSIFIIGSIVGRFAAGKLINDMGTSRMLLVGLLFFSVTSALYFITFNLSLLLINRLLQGVAVGLSTTATGTIIAEILPDSRKGEGIGYYSLSGIFATAIGPFVGILLIKLESGFYWIFTLNIIFSIICLVIFYVAKIDVSPKSILLDEPPIENKASILSKFFELKAIPISFIALLIGFSYSGIMSFITFYAEEIDLVLASSYFFLCYAIVVVFSRPFTGKLLDIRGANIVVYPCLFIFALGMLLFSQATTGWVLLLSAIFIGLGYGNFNSVAQAIAVKVTNPRRFGLAISTYFIFFDAGLGFGPYLLGFFVPIVGYRTIFLYMVGLILMSIPFYYVLHGRKDRKLLRNM